MTTHPTPPKIVQCPIHGMPYLTKGKNYEVIWSDLIWGGDRGYLFQILNDAGGLIMCKEKNSIVLDFNDWLIIEREPAEAAEPVKPVKPAEPKQTAVEWLFEQLPEHLRLSRDGFDMLQQAKQMEREQIIDAVFEGYNYDGGRLEERAQEYYQQTYQQQTCQPKTEQG